MAAGFPCGRQGAAPALLTGESLWAPAVLKPVGALPLALWGGPIVQDFRCG